MRKFLIVTLISIIIGAVLTCLFLYWKKLKAWFKQSENNNIAYDDIEGIVNNNDIVVYTIDILTIKVITDWFYEWETKNEADYDDVGFAFKEKFEKGDIKVIQGVFNKNSGIVKDARRIEAMDVDDDTRLRLGKEKLTIFC